MSIWGRRIDGFFARGKPAAEREDYNRAGLNALWQIALVALVLVAVFVLGRMG